MTMKYALQTILYFSIVLSFSSCQFGRALWYNVGDIDDYKKFQNRTIQKGNETFYFKSAKNTRPASIDGFKTAYLDSLVENTPTVAFLIIRNDTILYERYAEKFDRASLVASFSAAKSYTATLLGIAIDEGFIESENELLIKYVPELAQSPGFDKITIKHLLQMTAGIKSNDSPFNPFSDAAVLYYGKNIRKYLTKLEVAYPPGERFQYVNANTQLLGLIVERATKKSLSTYLQEKIWTQIGMEYDATWSIDRKKEGIEKSYCCLNTCAIDYAKFGRLFLNKGNWNGKQIVSEDWVQKSTKVDTLNGSRWDYQYQWWLNDKNGNFSARGMYGQQVYVNPSKNIVMVRLGKRDGKEGDTKKTLKWHDKMNIIQEKMNAYSKQ